MQPPASLSTQQGAFTSVPGPAFQYTKRCVAAPSLSAGPKGAEASPSETEAPAAKCSSIGMEELKMQMVAMVAPNPRPNDVSEPAWGGAMSDS